jgi:hypothetical protein
MHECSWSFSSFDVSRLNKNCLVMFRNLFSQKFCIGGAPKQPRPSTLQSSSDWRLKMRYLCISYLRVICFWPKIQSFFVKKPTTYSKPWTSDSEVQDGYCKNAPTFFGPICLPKPKSLGFSKKKLSLGVRLCLCTSKIQKSLLSCLFQLLLIIY